MQAGGVKALAVGRLRLKIKREGSVAPGPQARHEFGLGVVTLRNQLWRQRHAAVTGRGVWINGRSAFTGCRVDLYPVVAREGAL